MFKKLVKQIRSYGLSRLPVLKGSDSLVLCFHSVNNFEKRRGYVSEFRSQPLSIFESQLDWLSTFCEFVSLTDIVEQIGDKASGRQKIALTFDDGYRDNLISVLPLLEKYDAPVTLFVATDYVGTEKLPWWDFMDWTIEHNYVCNIETGRIERRVMSSAEEASQRECFRKLCRDEPQAERDLRINYLIKQCGCHQVNDFMSFHELGQFSNHKLTSIGAHTHRHFNTSLLTSDELTRDLEENMDLLLSYTQSKITHFAYPYGGKKQVCSKSVDTLKRMGVKAAFTTEPDCVTSNKSNFELPRMIISPRTSLTGFKAQINSVLFRNTYPRFRVL